MSGIYISGAKMPKDRAVFIAIDNGDVFIRPLGSLRWAHLDEKVVEIPDHGDLIGRDALVAAYDAEHVGPPGRARELMLEAPAVIQADKEAEA